MQNGRRVDQTIRYEETQHGFGSSVGPWFSINSSKGNQVSSAIRPPEHRQDPVGSPL